MKKKVFLALLVIICLGISFFAGMEFKAYQIRSALRQAFQTSSQTTQQTTSQPSPDINSDSILQTATHEGDKIVQWKINDLVKLQTMSIRINSASETQTLSGGFGNPKVAPAGSKFVLVNLTITNLTNSSFNFDPSNGFILVDNKNREFKPITAIGNVDNYIDERTLQPSIPETGVMVYQIPSDATTYSFNVLKGGAKELDQIILK